MKKILIILCILLLGSAAFAVEYSAEYVTTVDGEKTTSKMFYAKDKCRMEVETEAGRSISICRFDKDVMWTLMPEQKMYMETELPEPGEEGYMGDYDKKELGKKIGSEKINGEMCDKYKVYADKEEKDDFMYVWISQKDSIVMKTASSDGSVTTEVKNLKKGKQAASLFEIPEGYEEMGSQMPPMPMDMPIEMPSW